MFGKIKQDNKLNPAGIGFGLTICKSLIEAMKGAIGFRSEYDKGTTFWFTLPICSDHD
jgi:signal transduction histidine kinase